VDCNTLCFCNNGCDENEYCECDECIEPKLNGDATNDNDFKKLTSGSSNVGEGVGVMWV
jgi:hypothetical protein